MSALNLGQWAAVATLVAEHCPTNPDLVAAVDAELAQVRAETTPEPETENPDG